MFLLAFWQVCKLKRQQADFQNKRMKNDRELERCTKSIDKHQKYYTAEIQRVKDEAKNATNVFEQQIRKAISRRPFNGARICFPTIFSSAVVIVHLSKAN